MQPVVFRSKVDAWLVVALVVAVGGSLAAVAAVAQANGVAAVAVAPLILAGAGLPLWLLAATYYTLDGEHLDVRSGPFRWRVPLKDIRAVTPTRNPLSSPALSLDRLRIDYGRGGSIMISPRDKDAFLRELERRRSAIGPALQPSTGASGVGSSN